MSEYCQREAPLAACLASPSVPVTLAIGARFDAMVQTHAKTKKGPKGSRAKVISELRQTQKLRVSKSDSFGHASPLSSPTSAKRPDLLTADLVEQCTEIYFTYIYPTVPILHRDQVKQYAADMQTSADAFCLIGALCSFIIIQPGLSLATAGEEVPREERGRKSSRGAGIVEEVVKMRKIYNSVENASTTTVVTAFLLSASYFGLEKHNSAWFYLREAITLAQILGMGDESTYVTNDPASQMRRQLYWLLFVADRAYVLHNLRPLTLHATILFPVAEDPEEVNTLLGLAHLVDLFRIIDDDLATKWNTARSKCSAPWLLDIQERLTAALPDQLECSEIQQMDLKVTQQWLRIVVWLLSLESGCLSTQSVHVAMTFTYPIDVSTEVVTLTQQYPVHTMEVHGLGFIEKLFDIACQLIDSMLVPTEPSHSQFTPQQCLDQFIHMITTLRGGKSRYVSLLRQKIQNTLSDSTLSTSFPQLPLLSPQTTMSYSSGSGGSTPYGSPPPGEIDFNSPLSYPMPFTGSPVEGMPPPLMSTSMPMEIPTSMPDFFLNHTSSTSLG
ncbi:hypothetical protein MMC25_002819 [Agyrium rufum]|nr:hypothetical protein [Agyrium rufum]